MGGPCCARILTTWFAGKERGTYWGMWNIAHNLGGFAAPLIAGGFAKSMGWQWGMWAPGIIGMLVGAIVLFAAMCEGVSVWGKREFGAWDGSGACGACGRPVPSIIGMLAQDKLNTSVPLF